jgi:hypothetical protein
MLSKRFPHRNQTRDVRALRIVACAVALLLFSLTGSAQEQSQTPQTPPPGEPVAGQDASQPPAAAPDPERWNLFYQATSIGQYHGTFHSPYSGAFSLQDYMERDASLTTTLFFGLRLEKNTTLYFDPEIAGGRRDAPPSVAGVPEKSGKTRTGIKARPTQPVDRAVFGYECGRLTIADHSVVLNAGGHGA